MSIIIDKHDFGESKKIYCSECMGDLVIHEYTIGLYVDLCPNCMPDEEEIREEIEDNIGNEAHKHVYEEVQEYLNDVLDAEPGSKKRDREIEYFAKHLKLMLKED